MQGTNKLKVSRNLVSYGLITGGLFIIVAVVISLLVPTSKSSLQDELTNLESVTQTSVPLLTNPNEAIETIDKKTILTTDSVLKLNSNFSKVDINDKSKSSFYPDYQFQNKTQQNTTQNILIKQLTLAEKIQLNYICQEYVATGGVTNQEIAQETYKNREAIKIYQTVTTKLMIQSYCFMHGRTLHIIQVNQTLAFENDINNTKADLDQLMTDVLNNYYLNDLNLSEYNKAKDLGYKVDY